MNVQITGVLAVRLVNEGGLLKQQLVAGGGERCVGVRQQGNGVVLHCLLQRRVGGAVVSSLRSSSLPLIKPGVGVHARCVHRSAKSARPAKLSSGSA